MTVAATQARRQARHQSAAIRALRPRQWTKNILLFAGLLFAGKLDEPTAWLAALAVFAAFCAVSSAAYLVNDVHDADADRLHPSKRFRPVASGELSPRRAFALAALLSAAGLGLAATTGWVTVAMLAGFGAVQLAYTFGLKLLAFVDVLAISGLFVLRAAAGAAAVNVRISPWLLVCTTLLALFLGLAKRRAELIRVSAARTPGRQALGQYPLPLVDRLVHATAFASIAAYASYAFESPDSAMAVTIPFVVAGLCRYLYVIEYRDLGEEPDHVLLSDPAIIGSVVCWVAVAATVLARS
jgi:4-hydroxybenzoate polyprenyltransferase